MFLKITLEVHAKNYPRTQNSGRKWLRTGCQLPRGNKLFAVLTFEVAVKNMEMLKINLIYSCDEIAGPYTVICKSRIGKFCIAFKSRTNKILPFQKVEICQFYL